MTMQPVTVNLPSSLYDRLARRASRSRRTVEVELVETVMTSLPEEPGGLPPDMSDAIAALHLLDDEELWRAARTSVAPERAAELEELHLKRQAEGLSAEDEDRVAVLMREYARTLLVRARAAAVLKQRGHDVSVLLGEDEP